MSEMKAHSYARRAENYIHMPGCGARSVRLWSRKLFARSARCIVIVQICGNRSVQSCDMPAQGCSGIIRFWQSGTLYVLSGKKEKQVGKRERAEYDKETTYGADAIH